MTKVKNVRPGLLLIADVGLKLAPGETASVEKLTAQMERCIEDGLLARVEPEPEAKSKPKSGTRSSVAGKMETREQPAKVDETNKEGPTSEVNVESDGGQIAISGADSDNK